MRPHLAEQDKKGKHASVWILAVSSRTDIWITENNNSFQRGSIYSSVDFRSGKSKNDDVLLRTKDKILDYVTEGRKGGAGASLGLSGHSACTRPRVQSSTRP